MTLTLTWTDIALRLLLTVVAGAVIGFERGERGRAAGLRTTLLVALAACLAMLQANLLLSTPGGEPYSFIRLDLMRLPLGILTGVGFIGAGAILRRGDLVLGVTTAATLWYVTVVGLLFGGGQILLGLVATALGIAILPGLRLIEARMRQNRLVDLLIHWDDERIGEDAIRAAIREAGLELRKVARRFNPRSSVQEIRCSLAQRTYLADHAVPPGLRELAGRPGILLLEWKA